MTRRSGRYGLGDASAFFEGLRPARQACVDQLRTLQPSGPGYHMIYAVIAAIDCAAGFFTGQRSFYFSSNPDQIGQRIERDAGTQ